MLTWAIAFMTGRVVEISGALVLIAMVGDVAIVGLIAFAIVGWLRVAKKGGDK